MRRPVRVSPRDRTGPLLLVRLAARLALHKKATEVCILDLRGISDAADYFLLATADSDTQVRAVADHVGEELDRQRRLRPWHTEGHTLGRWVLLDYVDFVVHVFLRDARTFYQLERLWGDARVQRVREGPPRPSGGRRPRAPQGGGRTMRTSG